VSNSNNLRPTLIIIDDPYVELSDADKAAKRQAVAEFYNSTICPSPNAIVSVGSVSMPAPIEEMIEGAAYKGL